MTLIGEKCEVCDGIKPEMLYGGIPTFLDDEVPFGSPRIYTEPVPGGCYCKDEDDS